LVVLIEGPLGHGGCTAPRRRKNGDCDAPEGEVPLTRAAMAKCSVILVAQLLALLVAFVGESLTRRIVREVWPKLSFTDSDFRKGDST
jgi:hypothetical protein